MISKRLLTTASYRFANILQLAILAQNLDKQNPSAYILGVGRSEVKIIGTDLLLQANHLHL